MAISKNISLNSQKEKHNMRENDLLNIYPKNVCLLAENFKKVISTCEVI